MGGYRSGVGPRFPMQHPNSTFGDSPFTTPDEFDASAAPPAPGRHAIGVALAWLAILLCTGYATWEANAPVAVSATASQPDVGQPLPPGMEGAGRVIVALGEWVSPDMRSFVLSQAAMLQTEGPKERMIYAIIAADLVGLDEANSDLDAIASGADDDKWVARSATDQRLLVILRNLYARDPATRAAGLGDDDRAFLEEHLGWFGRFAPLVRGLSGDGRERAALLEPVKNGPIAVAAFMTWMLVCGAIGLVALIVMLVMGLTGRLRHGFGNPSGRGWVYAEAFALWLALFFALRFVSEQVVPPRTLPDSMALLPTIVIQMLCFVASLAWAKMRAGSFRVVREDIGLHAGRGFFREVIAGVLTYCMALPMLRVGVLLTVVLMAVQKVITPDAPPPSHPVQQMLMGQGWTMIVMTLVLGAVIAPIVEETAFRGMLYRHLRDATASGGIVLSFIFAAGASSFIFATIHPQGWTVIPALASLAMAFCLGREWRGSLIPGMVAHGINNFVIMTLSIMLFRG